MVLCAALKIEMKEQEDSESRFLILPCCRHGDGFSFLKEFGHPSDVTVRVAEQGFILTDGTFLNRRDALHHAIECGQLSRSTRWYKEDHYDEELFSEDLY